MRDLIETVEKFLTFSDEKLAELAEKNKRLKLLEEENDIK